MAYDCIDGWSDMIEALDLDLEAEGIDGDDAQEVATLAVARIVDLRVAEKAARAMLAALKEAHAFMQDRDRLDFVQPRERTYRAARAIAAAEAAGIKTTVEG